MSRDLPTGYAALAASGVFRPVFMVDLDWPGGAVYAWGGYGSISWNGHTYIGTGKNGTISEVSESSDGRANGLTLTITGIPSDVLVEAMANDSQGRSGKVWLAGMADDGTFGADPYCIFDGVIDVCPTEDSGVTGSISVQLEKELIDRRINSWRNTHEDQQIEYPGDMFFEYVAGLATQEGVWGGKVVGGSGGNAGAVEPNATSGGGLGSAASRFAQGASAYG